MKKYYITLSISILFFVSVKAQNTYPPDGPVGIGTTHPEEHLHITHDDEYPFDHLRLEEFSEGDFKAWNIDNERGDLFFKFGEYGSPPLDKLMVLTRRNGYLGLGVTDPWEKFHIDGNILQNSGYYIITEKIKALNSSGLKLYNSSNDGVFINNSGNVGVGTTSPSYDLDVSGNVNFTGDLNKNGILFKESPFSNSGNDIYYNYGKLGIGTSSPTGKLTIEAGGGSWLTLHTSIASDGTDSDWSFDYADQGNVLELNHYYYHPGPGYTTKNMMQFTWWGIGIGCMPTSELDVNGSINFSGELTKEYQPFREGQFETSGSDIYYDGGNVGIGTTDPGNNKLSVEGDPGDQQWLVNFQNDRNANAIYGLRLKFATNDDPGNNDKLFAIEGNTVTHFMVNGDGQVGIGTTDPDYMLTVAGGVHASEVKVTIDAGADFIFEDNYSLPLLTEVESFVKQNRHLPDIPSEKQMIENGLDLGEMQIKLLQKVEELTLYIIEQQKEIRELKNKMVKLEK